MWLVFLICVALFYILCHELKIIGIRLSKISQRAKKRIRKVFSIFELHTMVFNSNNNKIVIIYHNIKW